MAISWFPRSVCIHVITTCLLVMVLIVPGYLAHARTRACTHTHAHTLVFFMSADCEMKTFNSANDFRRECVANAVI